MYRLPLLHAYISSMQGGEPFKLWYTVVSKTMFFSQNHRISRQYEHARYTPRGLDPALYFPNGMVLNQDQNCANRGEL